MGMYESNHGEKGGLVQESNHGQISLCRKCDTTEGPCLKAGLEHEEARGRSAENE